MSDGEDAKVVELVPSAPQRYIHSDIFDRLVTEPDDLPGLVAYGLYQQRKRQWMADHESKFGRQPSEEELRQYAFGYRDGAVEALKNDAQGILFRFSEEVIELQKPDLIAEAFNARTQEELGSLRTSIKKISGYRHHIVGHVVGFLCLLALAFIFTVAIRYEPHLGSMFTKH